MVLAGFTPWKQEGMVTLTKSAFNLEVVPILL
jgi:hypothetical protein